MTWDGKEDLIERCRGLADATVADGAFSPGPAIWVGKREVAHFDADGTLDVRLTRQVIRARRPEFRADDRISLRAAASDWLEIRFDDDLDIGFALSLIADAVTANLPTAKPGPPPTGQELARRRRFH